MAARWPKFRALRDIGKALAARAMLRAGGGDIDGAIDDIIIIHSLGRSLSRHSTLIQWLVGIGVENIACHATDSLLSATSLSPDQARRLLDYLLRADPPAALDVPLDFERIYYLDVLTAYAYGRFDGDTSLPQSVPLRAVNWDRLLREYNVRWGRYITASQIVDAAGRRKAFEDADREMAARLTGKAADTARTRYDILAVWAGPLPLVAREKRTDCLAIYFDATYWPRVTQFQSLADQATALAGRSMVALALVIYHHQHGRYPDDLSALAPEILDSVPNDAFLDVPFVYELTDTGCRLYSVGMNLVDDGGLNADESDDESIPADADDLVIELTAPQSRATQE